MWRAVLLLGALTTCCGDVQVDATSLAAPADGGPPLTNRFTDPFDALDPAIWTCEGSCPTASNGLLTFSLLPGVEPDNAGSWSKIRFVPRRFTSGTFTVNFALSPRPTQPVYWGMALWDEGPSADQSQYNEINLGCTTGGSSTNTQLDLVSARLGQKDSLTVDADSDLYDGSFHTGRVVYDSTRVEFYLDDELLGTITDTNVIPTDPLSLILGTRLVTTPVLTSGFDQIIDSCEIEW